MSTSSLYWILKLDDLRVVLHDVGMTAFVLGVIGVVLWSIVGGIGRGNNDDEMIQASNFFRKLTIPFLFSGIFFLSTHALLPSTKQMAVIYVVPQIVNNDKVQKLPGKLLKLADDWIDKLSPVKPREIKK